MKRRLRSLLGAVLLLTGACTSTPEAIEDGRILSFDGVELAYDSRGSGEPTLLFVHGWCCSREHWGRPMTTLADEYRVVAVDLAGHGDSGKGREAWNVANFSRDVVALIEALELEQVILVGHSMGGPVSLGAAAAVPERIVGVIGVDTLHDAEVEYTAEMMAPVIAQFEADFEGTAVSFVSGMFPEGTDLRVIDGILRDVQRAGSEVGTAILRSYAGYVPAKAFAACPVPLICINATQPNPTMVENNRAYIPDFEVVLVEDVGHFLVVERPETFEGLLRTALVRIRELADARPN